MAYELTETGKEKVHSFIAECTMRSKNQDAGTGEAETRHFPRRTASCLI